MEVTGSGVYVMASRECGSPEYGLCWSPTPLLRLGAKRC